MADRLNELAIVLETLDAHGLQTAAERVRWATAEIERLRKALTNDGLILIRECVRPLDCGHLHCRYCRAESPTWDHSEHCPYADSVRKVEQARLALDRIQAALRGEASHD